MTLVPFFVSVVATVERDVKRAGIRVPVSRLQLDGFSFRPPEGADQL